MKFDRRFLQTIYFEYSEGAFRDSKVLAFQDENHLSIILSSPFKLEKTFIGSLVMTNDQDLLHSYFDYPAVITPKGDLYWYKNGVFHRDDGPAIIRSFGSMYWLKNGKLHREDGPAFVSVVRGIEWWEDNKQHRKNGPAIIRPDGSLMWVLNNKLHREGGPAVVNIIGKVEEYWLNDIRQRVEWGGDRDE